MLTTFLIDFPVGFAPGVKLETWRGVGRPDIGVGDKGGLLYVLDGTRRPVLGVLLADLEGGARAPVLFLVFGTGRAGRAMLGGPFDGRDGRGSVAAIVR